MYERKIDASYIRRVLTKTQTGAFIRLSTAYLRRKQLNIIIISLFTLGSIYSTNASGTEKMNIIQIELNRVKNPNWPEAN